MVVIPLKGPDVFKKSSMMVVNLLQSVQSEIEIMAVSCGDVSPPWLQIYLQRFRKLSSQTWIQKKKFFWSLDVKDANKKCSQWQLEC